MNTSGTYTNTSGGGSAVIVYDFADGINDYTDFDIPGFSLSTTQSSASGKSQATVDPWTKSWYAKVTATATTGFSFAYFNSSKASNVTSNPYTQQIILDGIYDTGYYNVSIYFSRNKYTITYDANGGIMSTTAIDQTVYYEAAIGGFNSTATRSGYSFAGWYTAKTGGTQYTTSTTITSNVTLYAHWTANSYTVSYDANGGSGAPSSSKYTYGTSYTLSSTEPTRTGYTFSGWSLGSAGGTLYQAGATISGTLSVGNHTWYANWTINTYTMGVCYYQQCATDSTSIYISSSLGSGTISSGSSKTLSSTYTTTTYTITVSRNNSSYDYYMNATTSSSTVPTTSSSKNSITYSWEPTSNATIYVNVYQRYTVTYNGNGKTSGTVPSTQYKIHGTSLTLSSNSLTKTNYSANGWNTATAYKATPNYTSSSTYSTNADLTLYANFVPNRCSVIIKLMTVTKTGTASNSTMGGTVSVRSTVYDTSSSTLVTTRIVSITFTSTTQLVQKNKTMTFTPTTTSGYVFCGVSTSSSVPTVNETTRSVTPTSATTLYVYFKETSNNLLKYDSSGDYYYFEDGYMPQTYAEMIESGLNANITNNGTLAGTFSLENGTSYKLASYNNNYYLGFTATKDMTLDLVSYETSGTYSFTQGTLYWFRFEPIRWRVSTDDWSDNGYIGKYDTNYTVVSDLVLWYDCMDTNENHEEGDKAYDMSFTSSLRDGNFETMLSTFVNAYTNGELLYSGSSSAEWQKFGETGQQNPVQIDTTHTTSDYELTDINKYTSGSTSSLRVASTDEIYDTVGNTKAKASCLVAFLMGSSNDQYSKYWTRDLGVSLNAGKVVAKNGLTRSEWLSNSNGIRFAYTMSEGSRGNL